VNEKRKREKVIKSKRWGSKRTDCNGWLRDQQRHTALPIICRNRKAKWLIQIFLKLFNMTN